jgi:hypothetical protein
MVDGFSKRPFKAGNGNSDRDEFYPDLSVKPSDSVNEHGRIPAPEPEQKPKIDKVDTISLDNDPTPPNDPYRPKPKKGLAGIGQRFKDLSTFQKIIVIFFTLVLLAALGIGGYIALKGEAPSLPIPTFTQEEEKVDPRVQNTLTGRKVQPETNKRQVTAVMIENSSDARPQGGLQEAGVVFEAIAEGGITRFMALYQDTRPSYVGPIRSVRPYYISWLQGFDAAVAHVGGSPEALHILRERGIKDIDYNPEYYQRVSDRYAPHNVFTSINQLVKFQNSKGYKTSNFTGFERLGEKGKAAQKVTARNINVNISSENFNSSYVYSKTRNIYLRKMAGIPHKDAKTNKQITPDVLVVMTIGYSIHRDGVHSVYDTVSRGKVHVFQNGKVFRGTWIKKAHDDQIVFRDGKGEPIKLNPGQTWVSMISDTSKLSFKP